MFAFYRLTKSGLYTIKLLRSQDGVIRRCQAHPDPHSIHTLQRNLLKRGFQAEAKLLVAQTHISYWLL